MINLFHKKGWIVFYGCERIVNSCGNLVSKLFYSEVPRNDKFQRGIAALVVTVVLLIAATIAVLLASQYTSLEQKINQNVYTSAQAFEAAEAGLNFGLGHLEANKDTILVDQNSDGYIDSYSFVGNLVNGSSYSVSYQNPIINNFNLIRITALGTSGDNTTQQTLQHTLSLSAVMQVIPDNPIITRGNAAIGGSSVISNPSNLVSIKSGGTVGLSGSATTMATNGSQTITSDRRHINGDIFSSISALANLTVDEMFLAMFNAPQSVVKNYADYYYQGGGNYSSTLDGKQGVLIWIDKLPNQQTNDIIINGNVTVGSPQHPVVLIVDGTLSILGTADVYGLVYVKNDADVVLSGTANIFGAVITAGNLSSQGNVNVTYRLDYLNNLRNSMLKLHKIPGSWIDL